MLLTLVVVVFMLRLFFPAHATPGWATTVAFGLGIILLNVSLTALSSILMLLNTRVQRLVLPLTDYKPYVASREWLFQRPGSAANRSIRITARARAASSRLPRDLRRNWRRTAFWSTPWRLAG